MNLYVYKAHKRLQSGRIKLLDKKDPPPVTVTKNSGNIIFTGPHNGSAVPCALPPYLGADPKWFNTAHEAVDLHMDKLFRAMQKSAQDISFIAGNYSRLVCDLNAIPDYAISECSVEHNHIKIPHNQPSECCKDQRINRLEQIYYPYHEMKNELIEEKRREHGGVIVLDIHSFTPTWEGQHRKAEIGTIRCEKTPLSRALEEYFKRQSKYKFISGEPYRIADRPSNAAPIITKVNDLQYIGIEIRNDLLETDNDIQNMVSFLNECVNHLKNHQNLPQIIQTRSKVFSPTNNMPKIAECWSI